MDDVVALGLGGFRMQSGARYRVLATIPNAAFQVLPWNAPGNGDIANSLAAPGFSDLTVTMPWDAAPADWPAEPRPLADDVFVVRGEGTWGGREALPASVPLKKSGHAITVAAVWLHVAATSVAPQPTPEKPAPRPRTPSIPSPPPAPSPPRRLEPLPPPKAPRGLSMGAKVALGGGAIAAATLLVAHTPFRRSRPA